MLNVAQNFIPKATSEAGLCLTAANWQEAGISSITYYLDLLLVKPGYDLLQKIPLLSEYTGWHGAIILNASRLVANREGIFTIVSPYDGSKLKLSNAQLIEIIQHLKPDAVILPQRIIRDCPDIWNDWNDAITPFIVAEDLAKQELCKTHGVYLHWDNSISNSDFLAQVKRWAHLPRYVAGQLSLDLISDLKNEGIEFIESDEPAAAAMQGLVFSQKGIVDLTNEHAAMQFEILDAECTCSTCAQQLTKAYLHHLLLHTPLLCQRFLIQHNVYYALNYIGN